MTQPNQGQVAFSPAIVVGLGGMGTSVACRVKELVGQELDRQVRLGLIDEATRSNALNTRFQFIGFDSWKDGSRPVKPWQELNFHELRPIDGVNDAVRRYLANGGFGDWWPTGFSPGNFQTGCGHVHVKGRLAYMIQRERGTDAGSIIAEAANKALQLLPQAPLADGSSRVLPVFVCTSLAGGTGGGMLLTILQSIARLNDRLMLYPVIIDESIASWNTDSRAIKDLELANNFTGLVELDAWMNSSPELCNAVGWRTFWPTDNPVTTIHGERPISSMVWLFHRVTTHGMGLGSQQEAISAAADTVATWIHSSSTASMNSFDSDIRQWVTSFAEITHEKLGRPSTYGSMGVAHLEFPVEQVLEYLGASLAIDAAQRHLLASASIPRDTVQQEVDDFLHANQLKEEAEDQILVRLRSLRGGLPPRPPLQEMLEQAHHKAYVATVNHAVQSVKGKGGRLEAYHNACTAEVTSYLSGPPGGPGGIQEHLRQKVRGLLAESADGLSHAREFLQTLRTRIEEHDAASIRAELEGTAANRGLQDQLDRNLKALISEASELRTRMPGQQGRRISALANGAWSNYVSSEEGIVERKAALNLYGSIVDEVELFLRALGDLQSGVEETVADLRLKEGSALNPPSAEKSGGATIRVLAKSTQVSRTFPWTADESRRLAATFVASESQGLVGRFDDLLAHLREVDAQRAGASDRYHARRSELKRFFCDSLFPAAKEQLNERVSRTTVWQALAMEIRAEDPAASPEAVVAHIHQRLGHVIDAARPMFPLAEGKLMGVINPPEMSLMFVAEQQAVADFGNELGRPQMWLEEAVRAHLGTHAFRSVASPDPHRATMVNRLFGFPLLGIPEQELQSWRAAYQGHPKPREVWSDMRARELPLDFEPLDGNRIREIAMRSFGRGELDYIAALGFGWGVLTYAQREGRNVDRGRIQLEGSSRVFANGLKAMIDHLEATPEDLDMITRHVLRKMDREFPRKQWLDAVSEVEDKIRTEWEAEKPTGVNRPGLSLSREATGSDRYLALDRMYDAVSKRLSEVQRAWNPNDSSTDGALEELRPKSRD